MNIKSKCEECGKVLEKGNQTTRLMHGPRGFRSYAVCLRCVRKAPLSAGTQTSPQMKEHNLGGVEQKAGV